MKKVLNDERFKMSWWDKSPFGDNVSGYLALSHEQNINAWFDSEKVTIRPTGYDPNDSWLFRMKLKSVGYRDRPQLLPAVIDRKISGTRIEYKRELGITEWYENRSNGIEQGFTLTERSSSAGSTAELQLVIISASIWAVMKMSDTL